MRLFLAILFVLAPPSLFAQDYVNEEQVSVRGYDGDLMEPFLSRDGKWLFFNNNNNPGDKTDLHYAEAGEGGFVFKGLVGGANSDKLDGVPSMDRDGRFYFISPRDFGKTKATLYQGDFSDGGLRNVGLVSGDVASGKTGWFNMDAEISADGQKLYASDNRMRFMFFGGVSVSNLFVAERDGDAFIRLENSGDIFAKINTDKLEYAAALTSDELTIFFNRTDIKALKKSDMNGVGIFMATRESVVSPFGAPRRIEAITGFVEGATVSPDACQLYYHRKTAEGFRLYKVTREDCLER